MDGLLNTVESMALRIAPLTGALIASDKLGIKDIILTGVQGDQLTEAVKYSGYLIACEMAGDYGLEKLTGMRAPSLHKDVGVGFLTSFATNVGVYYALDRTDILDRFIEMFGSSDESIALANAVVYGIVQEVSYRLLAMWLSPDDPKKYGNKTQSTSWY